VITDGELVVDVVPHMGYLHRCFEKHAEALPYNQVIPYVDRTDYLGAMNMEHAYVMGVERMLGLDSQLPPRVEYLRIVVAELNRLASHFVSIGTYGMDIGAFTPFLWMMRDREHILRMLEWLCGARMLYNYMWVGGLFYDTPNGWEGRVAEFCKYLVPKLDEVDRVLVQNTIFINRTAGVGVLPMQTAINYGVTGPMLRASGLAMDIRKADGYSLYPELDFEVPVGEGRMGEVGDCWDRNWVRLQECRQSIRIIEQCLEQLTGAHKATPTFDVQALCPKKIRPEAQDLYSRAEGPRGETGFWFRADGKSDIAYRCKARGASFCNLSVLPALAKGHLIADLIAIVGSIDMVLGDVDR
jgi:NADH-quinone oxidoreductase subunit D